MNLTVLRVGVHKLCPFDTERNLASMFMLQPSADFLSLLVRSSRATGCCCRRRSCHFVNVILEYGNNKIYSSGVVTLTLNTQQRSKITCSGSSYLSSTCGVETRICTPPLCTTCEM